ncbi:uncharacterized protein LOC110627765 [Manihot esculenta]|uniref:Uncharacterized protein n=1 Tax=Manihot esculenta TaxID=3983 RepID=A0A2C9USG7_MANES|nr:uncharacterized protein LOC110627765 [Manihot esculenta]OAY34278.1 hypothetical protein MANES_12G008400v8 [Manihot esculenta]
MKIKNKGKVYPSPASSSSSVAAIKGGDRDVLSVLKLLPAAILALASVLSLEDREVLAYMITRSLKTTTNHNPNDPSSLSQDSKRKSSKKPPNAPTTNFVSSNHKPPIFDCDCFDCYTSYWFRWDSSSNRELIHQVIEAFEEHLTNGEQSRKSSKGKRRDRVGRRVGEKPVLDVTDRPEMLETPPLNADESSIVSPDDDVPLVGTPERAAEGEGEEEKGAKRTEEKSELVPAVETEEMAVVRSPQAVSSHKGLARKVLPDVLGLLNSRLWSLWGPNV